MVGFRRVEYLLANVPMVTVASFGHVFFRQRDIGGDRPVEKVSRILSQEGRDGGRKKRERLQDRRTQVNVRRRAPCPGRVREQEKGCTAKKER
jgi:hypothetical protein